MPEWNAGLDQDVSAERRRRREGDRAHDFSEALLSRQQECSEQSRSPWWLPYPGKKAATLTGQRSADPHFRGGNPRWQRVRQLSGVQYWGGLLLPLAQTHAAASM